MASFYVENFGCRATQADGAAVERQFQDRGLVRADQASEAEVVVLNTCTVTASADRDARAAIRRVHRENPGCQIVVTGCYAQRAPEEIAALPGVSRVVGNSHKHRLAEIALQRSDSGPANRNPAAFVPLGSLLLSPRPATNGRSSFPTFLPTPSCSQPRFSMLPTNAPAPTLKCRTAATTAVRCIIP